MIKLEEGSISVSRLLPPDEIRVPFVTGNGSAIALAFGKSAKARKGGERRRREWRIVPAEDIGFITLLFASRVGALNDGNCHVRHVYNGTVESIKNQADGSLVSIRRSKM
jgi:hypothetical protein